jgi:hypothetical protein
MVRKFNIIIAFVLLSINLFAQEYSTGDIIEENGISYKVLVTYLVVHPKESPDTIKGPDKFHQAGELMVVKVDKKLKDVIIPPEVGRFKVIGLTDSLFYEHEHDRIWLPDLSFAGNGCFAKLKMGSGALVIHNISNLGMAVFDELEADLILDITKQVSWGDSFRKMRKDSTFRPSMPNGKVKIDTKYLKLIKNIAVYNDSYSATHLNYRSWINKAFNNDEAFIKINQEKKISSVGKRTYSTTPRKEKKGLNITASITDVKKLGYPWGNLTQKYYRLPKYTVMNKKKRVTKYYHDFIPTADATLKEGWYVKFIGEEGEVKFRLNGKKIRK